MFGGGFNPAKCKTALRLCIGRIKLLKNKKGLAVRALRKEIADLIRANKTDSARVRIEGVMREEANLEAFDILDLFCELLVVRLRLIEQEKDLPDDLKEAVATCIYAAKRMGELPELTQIKAQFAAKYGREYAHACEADGTAAACGVNRTAIQKLSVRPPTNEDKLEKLRAIAAEHAVPFDEEETSAALARAHTPSRVNRDNADPEGGGVAGYADVQHAAAAAAQAAGQAQHAAAAAAALAVAHGSKLHGSAPASNAPAPAGAKPPAIISNAPLPPPGFLVNSLSGKSVHTGGGGMDKGRSLSEVIAGTPSKDKDDGTESGDTAVHPDDDYVADLTPPSAAAPPAKPPPVTDPTKPSPPPGIAGTPGRDAPGGEKESESAAFDSAFGGEKKPEFGPVPPPKPGDPLGEPDMSQVDPNKVETHFRDLTARFNALKKPKD